MESKDREGDGKREEDKGREREANVKRGTYRKRERVKKERE